MENLRDFEKIGRDVWSWEELGLRALEAACRSSMIGVWFLLLKVLVEARDDALLRMHDVLEWESLRYLERIERDILVSEVEVL